MQFKKQKILVYQYVSLSNNSSTSISSGLTFWVFNGANEYITFRIRE